MRYIYNITKEKTEKRNKQFRTYLLFGILVFLLLALIQQKSLKLNSGGEKTKLQPQLQPEEIMQTKESLSLRIQGKPAEKIEAKKIEAKRAGFSVISSGVGTGVKNRTLTGKTTVFPSTVSRVYYFTEIEWCSEPEGKIFHNWYYRGELESQVKLKAGNVYYRTWSCKSISEECVGDWTVKATDGRGNVFDLKNFKVVRGQ